MTRDEVFEQWADELNIYPGARHIYREAFGAGYDKGWFVGFGQPPKVTLSAAENETILSLTLDKAY